MAKKTDSIEEIDLLNFLSPIWINKSFILKLTLLFLLFGLIHILNSPNIFKSSSTFYPHYENSDNGNSSLRNLAGIAGINIQNELDSNIPSNLYPNLIRSSEFKRKILKEKIFYNKESVFYNDYLINENKNSIFNNILSIIKSNKSNSNKKSESLIQNLNYVSNDEYDLFKILDNNILINVNKKDGIIELSVFDKDPEVSSQIAIKANDILQESIINFKIKNIAELYDFTLKQLEIAKINMYNLEDSLANFKDSNRNIKSDVFLNQLNRIETEYNISKNIYNELALTKEKTAIDVRKNTPIFTIIDPVVVPNVKYSPNRLFILISYTMFGLFSGVGFIIIKKPIKSLFKVLNKKEI